MDENERQPIVAPKKADKKCEPLTSQTKSLYIAISFVLLAAVVAIIVAAVLVSAKRSSLLEVTFPVSDSPAGVYQRAAVACDSGYCSTVGRNMLEKNGSAADAAIAALLCDSVLNIHKIGMGGVALPLVWDSNNKSAYYFDGSGVAPLSTSEDLFVNNSVAMIRGKLSVLLPSAVAVWHELHSRFGRLPWRDLFTPAIDLCRKGFRIGPSLAQGIAVVRDSQDRKLFSETNGLVAFLKDNVTGAWLKEGDTLFCPELASTFKMLAENGADDFYNGSLAKLILADMQELGIPITKADFQSYRVISNRSPMAVKVGNTDLTLIASPVTGGISSAFTLKILSGYNMTPASSKDPLTYHRYIEAFKFSSAQMYQFGDIDFPNNADLENRVRNMTSHDIAEFYRKRINDNGVLLPAQYGLKGGPLGVSGDKTTQHQSTTHISVLDGNGNAVSMTASIVNYFGSYTMGRRTGIVFNNGMSMFFTKQSSMAKLISSDANYIKPGKRPFNIMSPLIFIDEKAEASQAVKIVVGAAGSQRIIATVPYAALRMLWFDETPKQALDALRLMYEFSPYELQYEPAWPKWFLDYMRNKGHTAQNIFDNTRSTIATAIRRLSNGTILANSDFRMGEQYTDGY